MHSLSGTGLFSRCEVSLNCLYGVADSIGDSCILSGHRLKSSLRKGYGIGLTTIGNSKSFPHGFSAEVPASFDIAIGLKTQEFP